MTTKSNFVDWLCIHLVRISEDDGQREISDPEIIRRIATKEKDKSGRLIDPLDSVAKRAKRLMPDNVGLTADNVQNTLSHLWLVSICGVVAFALLMVFSGKAFNFLPLSKVVDLGSFALAFGFLLFCLVFYVFFSIVSTIWSWFGGRENSILRFLTGVVGFVGSVAARYVIVPDRGGNSSRFITDFFKSRYLSNMKAVWTHIYWLTFSLFLFFWMLTILSFNDYDFSHKTTILKGQWKERFVCALNVLGYPGSHFGFQIVTSHDIDQISAEKKETINETNTAEIEYDANYIWGWYISGLILTWGVLARLPLLIISGAFCLLRRSDFKPNLSEPYFKNLIAKMEAGDVVIPLPPHNGSASTKTEVAVPMRRVIENATKSMTDALMQVEAAAGKTTVVKPIEPDSLTLVCGCLCDEDVTKETWQSLLPKAKLQVFNCLVNDFYKICEWIGEYGEQVQQVVILFATNQSPYGDMMDHLAGIVEQTPSAQHFVIFSCGERMRKQCYSNEKAIRELRQSWQSNVMEAGIQHSRIINFDHENQTDESLQQAQSKLAGDAVVFRPAGKFDEASRLILKSATAVEKSPAIFAVQTTKLHDEISRLYAPQVRLFNDVLSQCLPQDAIKTATDAMESVHSVVNDGTAFVREQVEQRVKELFGTWYYLRRYCPSLDTVKNGLIGGGIGIGTAVVATLLVANPATVLLVLPYIAVTGGGLGVLSGVLLSTVPAQLRSYFYPEKTDATPSMPSVSARDINELVKASATWALILEMQGLPEHIIAKHLDRLIGELYKSSPDNEQGRRRVLETISSQLKTSFPQTTNE